MKFSEDELQIIEQALGVTLGEQYYNALAGESIYNGASQTGRAVELLLGKLRERSSQK